MSDEMQLLLLTVLAVYEIYASRYHDYPLYAKFWDVIARISGAIANFFASMAMNARLAYYEAVGT